MKVLKFAAVALVALLAVVLVGGLLLPNAYRVERSTTIDAPVAVVYEQIADLERQEAWNAWKKADDTMVWTYGEVTRGSYTWTSENSGDGVYTIEEATEPTRVVATVDFGEMGRGTATWDIAEMGPQQSRVTWAMSGESPGIVGAWMNLVLEGMIGADFERGLASLADAAENAPLPEPVEPIEPMPPADDGADPADTDTPGNEAVATPDAEGE